MTTKDKDQFFKWFVGIVVSAGLSFSVAIFNKIDKINDIVMTNKNDIEWLKKKSAEQDNKNDEQDKKLSDQSSFTKPEEIKPKNF